MSIKSDLNTLQTNIQNAKDKLYTNLTNKGVTTITTASTLDAMADSVSSITVGEGDKIIIESNELFNSNWLIQPEQLKEEHIRNGYRFNWVSDDNGDMTLLYPTGDYVFNNNWNVAHYSSSTWVQSLKTNNSAFTTRSVYECGDFFRLKVNPSYKLVTNTWNGWTEEQDYYEATELPLNNIETIYIYTVNNEIFNVSADTTNEFKFYEYNKYTNEYTDYYFINPLTSSEYSFYPVVTTYPYYRNINYAYYEEYNVIGGVINGESVNNDVLQLPAYMGKVNGEYLLFAYQYQFYDKFSYTFSGSSNGYDYGFDYNAPNLTKLENVNMISSITNFHYGFLNTYIDYVGEFVLNDNLIAIYSNFTGEYMEYMLLKNIGKNPNATMYSFSSSYWGSNEKYPNSRDSLIGSLITYSTDRTSVGYSTCTIALNVDVTNRLTDDEIAQITAKGFTIA